MLKRCLLCTLLCFFCVSRLYAADITVKADNVLAHSQTSKTMVSVPITLSSDIDLTSLQFDLYLPNGFTFKSVDKGDIANASQVATSSVKEGYTRIVLYSSQNQVFKVRSGVAANITLEVDTALASKDYDVLLKDIYVSDASKPANRYSVSDQHSVVSVTTLAERIVLNNLMVEVGLGESCLLSASIYPTYTTNKSVKWTSGNDAIVSVDNGNVLGKGKGLTDIIVMAEDGSNVSASCHAYSDCFMLYTENASAHSQSMVQELVIPVKYNANADNSSLQFDLHLPDGFAFKSVAKGDIVNTSHVVTSSKKDGYTRIVLYSSQNQVFKARSGVAVNITLEVDTALASKDYDVLLKDIYVSDAFKPANRYSVSDQHSVVSVTTLAERIVLNNLMVEVGLGESCLLSASIYPTYTTNKSVKWTSGNDAIVSVDNGNVLGKGKGLTDIIVMAEDGSNVSALCHAYSDCFMLYTENTSAHSQSTVQEVTIPVKYSANADNSSLQFDLYLPEGFTFKSVDKGDIANTSHVVTSSVKESYTRIVLYSSQNQVFKARSGVAANITLEVDTALASKDYDVLLKDIYVSDTSKPANRYPVSDQHSVISLTTLAERIYFTTPFTVLRLNESAVLTPVVFPYYTTDKQLVLKSSDASVARIEGSEVESLKQGLVSVTAETKDGSNLSASHQVYSECSMLYVDNRTVYSQSIGSTIKVPVELNAFNSISHLQFDLYLPEGFSLESVEKSELATDKQILAFEKKGEYTRILYYTSDNTSVSQIRGNILYLNINVDKHLEAKNYNAWLKNVKLSANMPTSILYEIPDWGITLDVTTLVESISLNKDTLELFDGQSETLNVMIEPDFAVNKTLSWKSQNESLAKVNSQGLVKVSGEGTTKVIVSTTDGSNLSDTCVVIVKPVLATALTMSDETLTIEDQCTYQLSCSIYPENTTYKNLRWTSDDSSVAQVDATAYVVAKKVGTTIIRATTTDGTMISASCEINVVPLQVKSLTFPSDTINIGMEMETSLAITITPENATDKSLNWESTNEAVASVDEYGVVKAKQLGSTKIVVTSVTNPSVHGECTIIVHGIESMLSVAQESENTIRLEWEAMYNKYEIADYNVYVSEDSKPFILWMSNTTATSATFKIKEGVSYRFLVTARDKAGNIEKYKEAKCVTIKPVEI